MEPELPTMAGWVEREQAEDGSWAQQWMVISPDGELSLYPGPVTETELRLGPELPLFRCEVKYLAAQDPFLGPFAPICCL